jgi:hypothetical protein
MSPCESINTSEPGRPGPIKLVYRVKIPLSARMKIDVAKSFKIPRGALVEWIPGPGYGQGFAEVRWLQEECLVSSAELNQNCKRIDD